MERPGLRGAAPFAACLAIGLGMMLLPQYQVHAASAVLALVLLGVAGVLFLRTLRSRRRTWLEPTLVVLISSGLAAIFHATGGPASPLLPLVAVPVLWCALFGRRRDLLLVAVLTVVLLLTPAVLTPADYDAAGVARAVLWGAITLLVGPAVQDVVVRWRIDRDRHSALSRELEQANARWRFVVDTIPETALVTLDEDLQIGLVAGSGAWAVGLRDAEGQNFSEFASSRNLPIVRRLVSKAIEGDLVGAELTSTANGHDQEVLVSPIVSSDDEESGHREVLLLARDVSRERQRARQVARERDRAERFFSESPHGIAVLTPDGVVHRANPALCHLAGVSEDVLVGQPLTELVEKGAGEIVQEHLDRVLSSGNRAQSRWSLRSAAGDPCPVAVSSSLMPADDSEGQAGSGLDGDAVLMHFVDMSEQERYENRLTFLANHDPLTGLTNRRRFEEELERHLDRCQRYGARGAVMMLDLDHFKEVNDTLGHPAGDQLIVMLGDLLRRRLRATDLVARLGGDEFAVLLPEADAVGAELTARDLVEAVREEVSTLDGAQHRVTASIGVLLLKHSKLTVSDVMSSVDMLLYDAKDGGRDRYATLDTTRFDVPRTAARLHWADQIEQALREDAFELHLQPILDVNTMKRSGAEALLRMRMEDHLVPPARFLYVAERSNLITRIDRWVIRHSVALLEHLQSFDPDFHLEVNLSGRSVGDPAVEAELITALRRNNVDPRGLVLEITETAAVAHIEEARRFAERLTQLGCSFALDDFGAGFGSFYYLKHLLFDYVKIDGEFVAGCDVDSRDRTILASIVQMAHGLGKKTIAEFVTSDRILEVVREEGVDLAQGFGIGRPVPVSEFFTSVVESAAERRGGLRAQPTRADLERLSSTTG
ncbi:putative bifunctional diguanylate cyclase/phosphodiesterase [Nocardioides ferulae]|uniref:putative bifunctional diguanylate cyclase/phosphodiesterase n=1 Tax=Nocardioides ferulae TaxID=2340821 RepID=UPI000EAE96B9|nr:GGDEF and EAL domain-containing protein [Nocardioides ferulae]